MHKKIKENGIFNIFIPKRLSLIRLTIREKRNKVKGIKSATIVALVCIHKDININKIDVRK